MVSAATEECQVSLGGLPRTSLRGYTAVASAVLLERGPDPSLINLNRHGSLQECYTQHQALMPSETQQDSLYATKRAVLNPHPMSNL